MSYDRQYMKLQLYFIYLEYVVQNYVYVTLLIGFSCGPEKGRLGKQMLKHALLGFSWRAGCPWA